jgi:outer membrane protein assembly factor BamD (BamD/ComL family)/DNA-binding transcriptional regulator/RsmH inhibitor MraZ
MMSTRISIMLLALLLCPALDAADDIKVRRGETLFQGAQRCFGAGQWVTAAEWFREYVENHPESPRRNMAILLRAQSLFRMEHFRDCFNELKNAEGTSGLLAAEFRFWMAECRYREAENDPDNEGNFRVAAQLYAEVPKSDRLVVANVSEAMAHARLEDWPRVVELLQPTTSPFQQFALESPESHLATQGRLILSEALLRQNLLDDTIKILDQLGALNLPDQDKWRRQLLRARTLGAQLKFQEALAVLNELLITAENRLPARRTAQVTELQIFLQDQLGEHAKALESAGRLWREEMSEGYRRRGLLLALELAVRHDVKLNIAEFEKLSIKLLADTDLAAVQHGLGELYLKQSRLDSAPEDMLDKAREQFAAAMGGTFGGRAQAGLAWTFWNEQRHGVCRTNFLQAATKLSHPEERSLFNFKAIEATFRSGDMPEVLSLGRVFLANAAPANLRNNTLILMARAAINEASDRPGGFGEARRMVSNLDSSLMPLRKAQATLLLARAESRKGNPDHARELLAQLSTNKVLKSEVDLEAAHTFIAEKNWPKAIQHYRSWLNKADNEKAPQRAKVTFDLGWLYSLNLKTKEAHDTFSMLIVAFSSTPEASRAQMWVADYYFNLGGDHLVRAEEAYQKVRDMKNCPLELKHRSTLLAGRSALARRNFANARDYFNELTKEKNNPSIQAEAAFALADTAILDPTSTSRKFDEAISILETIIKLGGENPSTPIIIQAHGRIGDCHLQMAATDPARYLKSRESYQRVIDSSGRAQLDPPVRYRAMLGKAMALKNMPEEKAGQRAKNLNEALSWAKKVFEGATASGIVIDPFWIRQSGLMAAELQILVGRPREAEDTFKTLAKHFSKMEPELNLRIKQLRENRPGSTPE